MPKFKLKNLQSITVHYQADAALIGKGWAIRVSLYFGSKDSADSFVRKLNPKHAKYITDSDIFNANVNILDNSNIQVDLEINYNAQCRTKRANDIISVLQQRYQLPKTLDVIYPEGVSINSKTFQTYTLATERFKLVGSTLLEFLENITFEQSNILSRLKNHLGFVQQVVRCPSDKETTSLEITVADQQNLIRFKKALFNWAVDNAFDAAFHIERVPGVAGAEHKNKCLLKINPGFNFCDLLERIIQTMPLNLDENNAEEVQPPQPK